MGNRKLRAESTFEGGVNTGLSLHALRDNESTDEIGFDTDGYPAATVRKGRTMYGASGSAVTRLLANFGNTHLVRAVGTKLQYDNGGVCTDITGTYADADWDETNFNGKLLLTNGTDNVKQWVGSILSDLAASAPKGKYITNDTLRVWIAKGDVLYFSGFLNEADWSSAENSGSVQYYTPNGGDITALRRFYDRVTVFKKDAMAEVQGRNYFNFQLVEISNDIGCVSFKTLQEVGDTLYWLGQNDVYGYMGGKPFPIGERIRGFLNRINPAYLDRCCAFTDGIKYYLCLVIDAATEPNLRLVFDPRYNVWRIPAQNENYRYGAQLNNVTYAGDASGQTWKTLEGTSDNGAAIPWSITTKPFDEGAAEAEKSYAELHLQGMFPSGSTLSVAISTVDRGGTFTTIDYDPTTAADYAQNRNVIVPLDATPLTHKARFRLSGTGPVEIESMQRYFRVHRVQR